jgi:hypothetical protein
MAIYNQPYNQEFARREFVESGEDWLMRHLAGQLTTVLDVGSNIGEWTRMTREFNPAAEIHTFEIVPDTYRKLLANIPIDDKIVPNGFGLSDKPGTIDIKYCTTFDAVSTYLTELAVENFEWRTGIAITGDQYAHSRRLDRINFLKLDVEGAEGLVLAGFKETIESNRVGIIQFEYGFANVLSRFLLVDAYRLLAPLGYQIGLLGPTGIEFRDYILTHETFVAPNYVAVHPSHMHLFP